MAKVVLVDKKDRPLGTVEKVKAHKSRNNLHKAFSIFIFNREGELLLQQRSSKKLLWPLYWSNTCCGHPNLRESYKDAAKRRLQEEFGFSCDLSEIGVFQYQAKYKDIGYENEICVVFAGNYNHVPRPEKNEIDDYKWLKFSLVKKDVKSNPGLYTPWFKKEIKKFGRFFNNYLSNL